MISASSPVFIRQVLCLKYPSYVSPTVTPVRGEVQKPPHQGPLPPGTEKHLLIELVVRQSKKRPSGPGVEALRVILFCVCSTAASHLMPMAFSR